MIVFQPRRIIGRWTEGYALDLHTHASRFLGDDEFGHPQFETTRTEAGDLLYRLKYGQETAAVALLAEALVALRRRWNPDVDRLVPVPWSSARALQPVPLLATEIARQTGLPLVTGARRRRDIPQLKNVYDLDQRLQLLDGLYEVDRAAIQGGRILLFDDLYRSGATMNEVTATLYGAGAAAAVMALTVTRTRSNQ